MFDQKKSTLFESKSTSAFTGGKATVVGTKNSFLHAGLKGAAKTRSGNGSLKFSTTGNDFVDQFGKCAAYKTPRTYAEVSKDMQTLWSQDKEFAIKFTLYLRLITRQVQLVMTGEKTELVQRGQGLRHEGIFRTMWIALNHPEVFWNNIDLFISVGSWKDVITMLSYDLQYNGWSGKQLDWNQFGQLILAGLENPNSSELIKKYLPQIKANGYCKTVEAQADNIIAKWICSLLFGSKANVDDATKYKMYRKLKTSGTAHEWQKLISQHKLLHIDFNTIHGRALAQLVSGKFLKKNGLETKYSAWIATKPVAKYTGYVYELLATVSTANQQYQIDTINKQFKMLVETAKKGANTKSGLIVVRDTSGSMSSPAIGTKIASGDVAKAMALFFSEMLPDGYFANSYIEFNSQAKMHQWKGTTVVDKWKNDRQSYNGSTNFMDVIHLFVRIKKQGVSETEFPSGILCISDGNFNPAMLGKTNVESARATLRSAGFSKDFVDNFQIILWDIPNGYYGGGAKQNFETYGDVKNVFYFSGLDGSIVSTLTGAAAKDGKVPTTAGELFMAAMDQEVLNLVTV